MAITRKPFFYDSQLKRSIVQVMAVFAGYQVRTGKQRDGLHRFLNVPVIFADYSRTSAYILGGGTDNTMSAVPIISVEMAGLKQAAELRRIPSYSEKIFWRERAQTGDGELGTGPGELMQGERFMPVAYEMRLKVSIWSSNNEQAFQLIEQIGTVFNPDLDLMVSNSPADWTFLSYIRFEGEFEALRVAADIGEGNADKFYVHNMGFTAIVHMNPPVKVYPSSLIKNIHTNILDLSSSVDFDEMDDITGFVID